MRARRDAAVPKPVRAAMRSTDSSVSSGSWQAGSTRRWVSHCTGGRPTSSRKRRENARTPLAGTVLSGRLTDRFGPRRMLTVHDALRGLTLLFPPTVLGPTVRPPVIVFVALFGLLDLATVPPTIALCRQLYGDDGPVVFGWVNCAHQAGAASAALLGGAVRDGLGSYDLVRTGTGALCATASLLLLVARVPPDGPQTRCLAKQRLSSSWR